MTRVSRAWRKHVCLLMLAGVVLLGGWLRFSQLDLMEFKQDECQLHELAVKQAGGELQLHGQMSSVRVHNPPMAVYLFALPALFSRDPVFMAGLPALLGTAAIGLTYLLARRWVSQGPALIAALLFAVSPWAVLESRKIWAQDLLPFFVLMLMLCAILWLKQGRALHLVLFAAMLAVITQIHYSGLALCPLVLFLIWKRRSRADLKRWLMAAAVFVLLWAPFLAFLAKSWPEEVSREAVGRLESHGPAAEWVNALKWQVCQMGHGRFANVGKFPGERLDSARIPMLQWRDYLFGALLAGGLAATILGLRRQPELWLILMWFFLPPVLLSLHRIYGHYLILTWPAGFLMIGILLERLEEAARRHLRSSAHPALVAAVSMGVALLAIEEVVFFRSFLGRLTVDGGTLRDYGVTYREKLCIARFLKERADDEPFLFLDETLPHGSEGPYYYIYWALLGGRGKMTPLNELQGPPSAPLFVALAPHVTVHPVAGNLKDAGKFSVGVMSVQCLVPIAAGRGG